MTDHILDGDDTGVGRDPSPIRPSNGTTARDTQRVPASGPVIVLRYLSCPTIDAAQTSR